MFLIFPDNKMIKLIIINNIQFTLILSHFNLNQKLQYINSAIFENLANKTPLGKNLVNIAGNRQEQKRIKLNLKSKRKLQ